MLFPSHDTLQRTAEFVAGQHETSLTCGANQADIRARAHHTPFPTTAGMLLFQTNDISNVDFDILGPGHDDVPKLMKQCEASRPFITNDENGSIIPGNGDFTDSLCGRRTNSCSF